MAITTTRRSHHTLAVYSRKALIGYIINRVGRDTHGYRWELLMRSEQRRGLPTGVSDTEEEALRALTYVFRLWCAAAGLCAAKEDT